MPNAIVTGGSGFVGTHLIRYLSEEGRYENIINIDIEAPKYEYSADGTEIHFLKKDIRNQIDPEDLLQLGCGSDTVIFNLAAICRIPGYPDIDYFRTNIKGADNICELARQINCNNIVFTSSIAPYGASEDLKTEDSIPQPDNPYGSSKLVAEYIHRGWQQQDPGKRKLAILRPGIIFGPNEQANFTRLYESLKSGFFVYPGRRDTRKACVYVKDVARACEYFAVNSVDTQIFNLVYREAPTIEEICEAITGITDAGKARLRVPGWLLIGAAGIINMAGKILNKDFTGIHPDRVKKVMISTNVSGEKLQASSFSLKYTLREGIIDWKNECGGILK